MGSSRGKKKKCGSNEETFTDTERVFATNLITGLGKGHDDVSKNRIPENERSGGDLRASSVPSDPGQKNSSSLWVQ